jgi:hypothetical protein
VNGLAVFRRQKESYFAAISIEPIDIYDLIFPVWKGFIPISIMPVVVNKFDVYFRGVIVYPSAIDPAGSDVTVVFDVAHRSANSIAANGLFIDIHEHRKIRASAVIAKYSVSTDHLNLLYLDL